MGLDMYVYKIKKLDEETKTRLSGLEDSQLSQEMGLNVFDVRERGQKRQEAAPLLNHISRYLTDIPTIKTELDFDLIRKDNKISEDWIRNFMYFGRDGMKICFCPAVPAEDSDEHIEVTIKADDIPKYWKKVPAIASVAYLEPVEYWRKAYDLADKISAACDVEVENCGFYPITRKMRNAIREYDGADIPCTVEDGWRYVYHEWY